MFFFSFFSPAVSTEKREKQNKKNTYIYIRKQKTERKLDRGNIPKPTPTDRKTREKSDRRNLTETFFLSVFLPSRFCGKKGKTQNRTKYTHTPKNIRKKWIGKNPRTDPQTEKTEKFWQINVFLVFSPQAFQQKKKHSNKKNGSEQKNPSRPPQTEKLKKSNRKCSGKKKGQKKPKKNKKKQLDREKSRAESPNW